MCQNLSNGRIVQNLLKLSFFFPTIASKYVCNLSKKTLFLSIFDILGLRDPHSQESRYFYVFVIELGSFLVIKVGNFFNIAAIVNKSYS